MGVVDSFGSILVLLLVVVAVLAVRRMLLLRGHGMVDCALRVRSGRHGGGWAASVARYDGDALRWYRLFSPLPRPRSILCRPDLMVASSRAPVGAERPVLAPGAIVCECVGADGRFELAMSEGALTGFRAWLEAAPPGAHLDRAVRR